ncbi:hypothetical protein [Corallococcus sp. EGB]|uniref:hypothetical protein n=1 Tax=Corallococcus sp. EGB TaxID=1521117 RepID=UPI001CBCB615|nr:hypothetical protein [Corallococcus sp. EGB]
MRHRLLVVLLAAGAIGGYASGFASLARHHRGHCQRGDWGPAYNNGMPPYWDWHAPRPQGTAGPSDAPGAR